MRAWPALALAVLSCCSDPVTMTEMDAANIVVGDGSFVGVDAAPIAPDAASPPDARASDATVTSSDAAAGVDAADRRDASAADAALADSAPTPQDAVAGDATPMPACDTPPVATLTASAALAQAGALDGMVVDVVGTATVTRVMCTRRACPPQNPCCNTCSAGVYLDGVLLVQGGSCSGPVGCTGNECSLVCTPPMLGFPQTFRGTMRAQPAPLLELYEVLP